MGQTMLYDLNVGWSPSTTKDQLLQLLTMSASLGYGTVALNHILTSSAPADHTSPFPDISPSSEGAPTATLPNILHRATLTLSDPGASTYRIPALLKIYDILAVRPLTQDAFQNACLTLDVPLISLDLTQHFPFPFRPKPCMAAVARGVRFEVCYGQFVGGGGRQAVDARGRANFISNVTSLVRATRGRGILISSEAKTALGLRPPADVVNLLSVWGLGSEHGMEGLRSIPRSVVVNEGLKRSGYKGVIDVVQVSKGAVVLSDDTKGKTAQPEQGSKKSKKQKRKNGEGGEQTQAGETRQNKKVKLVSRESKKNDA